MPKVKFKQLNQNVTNTLNEANLTGSLRVTGSVFLTQDLSVGGILTAQEFHTELVSASIIYESGSTKFGDTLDDRHTFTGSVNITGSFFLNNTDILQQIQASGIFRQTGSYWSATNDLKVTGSFNIGLDGSEDVVTVDVNGTERFKVNEEGVVVLGPFYSTPTPVSGGMYYSGSNEFFLGF